MDGLRWREEIIACNWTSPPTRHGHLVATALIAKHWLVTAAKRESSNVADGLVPLGHEDRLADRAVGDPVDVWLRKAHPSWLRPRRQRRTGMQPHEAGKVRRKECILTHVRIATLATRKIVGCVHDPPGICNRTFELQRKLHGVHAQVPADGADAEERDIVQEQLECTTGHQVQE
jgi:hypothetical protein